MTDPDSGLFVKGDHKRQFAYEAHTACDKHGFVLEAVITPGNVHDSVAFDEVYDRVTETFPEAETIVADSAYKTPHICKKVFEDGRALSTAYKRPQTLKDGHPWWKYVYDEHYDCVLCPEYQALTYRTTNRDGYREYKSDPKICVNCPTRHLCTHSKDCVKTVQRHIWKDYEELADDARYTPKYQDLYQRRKETIERVFADAKEKHAMRYTQSPLSCKPLPKQNRRSKRLINHITRLPRRRTPCFRLNSMPHFLTNNPCRQSISWPSR